jgi:hypothetical protein
MCYSRCLSLALVSLLLLAAAAHLPTAAYAQQPDDGDARVVIRFTEDAVPSEIAALQRRLGAETIRILKTADAELWEIPRASAEKIAARHRDNWFIEDIQPEGEVQSLSTSDALSPPSGTTLAEAPATKPARASNCPPEVPPSDPAYPNDRRFDNQWPFYNSGTGNETVGGYPSVCDADIDALEAWEIATGKSSPVTVAIIGFGSWRHEDLYQNLWNNLGEDADGDGEVVVPDGSGSWKFDPDDENGIDDDGNGKIDDFIGWDFLHDDNDPKFGGGSSDHTAKVAGIVGAKSDNNETGVASTHWNTRMMMTEVTELGVTSAPEAVDYAVDNGAKVISASWKTDASNTKLRDAIERAGNEDVLFVAGAGNGGCSVDNDPNCEKLYPASWDLDNIISVTGVGPEDSTTVTFFHNGKKHQSEFKYGRKSVDLAAPAAAYRTTLKGDRKYGSVGIGYTSYAIPQVTAAASLLLSQDSSLSANELKSLLIASADPVRPLFDRTVSGGRLNIYNALRMLKGLLSPTLTINNETVTVPDSYFARDTLVAGGNLTLDTPRNGVKFVAGERIRIEGPFEIKKGTPFIAEVRPAVKGWRTGGSAAVASNDAEGSNTSTVADESSDAAKTALPDEFALNAPYPNPVQASRATVPLALPERADVTAVVYDVRGRRIEVLANGSQAAGRSDLVLSTDGLASGMYLIRVKVEAASGETHTFTESVTIVQ